MSDFIASQMADSELVIEGRLVDASNATLYGRLISSSHEEMPVVYKPIAGEKPLWDFPDGTLAGREVAAYQISSAIGFDIVPETIMRDGPFGPGAVQRWIEIDQTVDFVALAQQKRDDIRKMALFDVVINNTDRKFGHILFSKTGEIYGCDHGVTFHDEFKLRTVLWQFAGEALSSEEFDLLSRIAPWLRSDDSTSFRSYLTKKEIKALEKRVTELISNGFPLPSTEWPAVPWPPV
jgi:uncharacterized repeat protein (TIGR03843 family)